MVHTVIALFAFLERKKKSPHRAIAPFQFLGHKLKRPVRVSIRLLISVLMKNEPFCYCAFRISRAQEKIATQGDFFNLRLRMVKEP